MPCVCARCARERTCLRATHAALSVAGTSELYDFSDAPVKHQYSSEERWEAINSCDGGPGYLDEVSAESSLCVCVFVPVCLDA